MQPASLGAGTLCVFRSALLGVLVVSVLGGFARTPACRAQTVFETPQQTNERIQALSLAARNVQREYVIGGGDLISIDVFDVKELSRDVRVSQAGTIALPLIPVRLHVAGLTEIQTEQKIAEVLEANGLVTHPQVSVVVKEKRSKPITVIGAVNHPMVFHAERPATLLEVLSEAGGIANDAGSTLIVTRAAPDPLTDERGGGPPFDDPKDPPREPEAAPTARATAPNTGGVQNNSPSGDGASQKLTTANPANAPLADNPSALVGAPSPPIQITVNLADLLESGKPEANMVLEAGDVVTVPRAGTVYAVGAVQRPGGFVLTNDRAQMTALKLLSLSGGLTRTAKSEHAVIVRKDGTGQQMQVAVDLKKILQQKTEDIQLRPSDILFVPESNRRQAAIRLAEIAVAIGTAVAIYRVAYH